MIKFKKIAAFLLSGVMCMGLAFGAACTDTSDSNSDNTDNTGSTDTGNTDTGNTDSGSTGGSTDTGDTGSGDTGSGSTDTGDSGSTGGGSSEGGSSEGGETTVSTAAKYIQAVLDTYDDFYVSTTGYEITMNGNADIAYIDEYSAYNAISLDITSIVKYKYADGVLGQDQDLFISGVNSYADEETEYTDSMGVLISALMRGDDIYGAFLYEAEPITSVPEGLMYSKINISDFLADYGMEYSDMLSGLLNSATSGLGDYSDIILKVADSSLFADYITVTTTESGATLTYDVLGAVNSLLTYANTIVGFIGEGTTIEDLAGNAAVRAVIESYLGGITAADIQSAVETIAQITEGEVTMPEATEGQSAYDYILSIYQYAMAASGTTSPDLSEYKETAQMVITMAQSILSSCDVTIELYFDGSDNYTGYNFSVLLDTMETLGVYADVQCGMEIVQKDVTLATIDDSMAYIYNDYVSYADSYDSAEIYFMADGTIVLGFEDEEFNVTYVNTGLTYTFDANGMPVIDGNESVFSYMGYSVLEYYVPFTYDGVDYEYYFYVEIA